MPQISVHWLLLCYCLHDAIWSSTNVLSLSSTNVIFNGLYIALPPYCGITWIFDHTWWLLIFFFLNLLFFHWEIFQRNQCEIKALLQDGTYSDSIVCLIYYQFLKLFLQILHHLIIDKTRYFNNLPNSL